MAAQKINVLIVSGGGSGEHDIAVMCASAILEALKNEDNIQVHCVEICKDGIWRYKNLENKAVLGNNGGHECRLSLDQQLFWDGNYVKIDYGIPYIPGYPGESGHLTSLLELMKVPYFGCTAEMHQACFNKVTQKLWCKKLNIPMVEYLHVDSNEEDSMGATKEFFNIYGDVVVKPARSGSSVGISQARTEDELLVAIKLAAKIDRSIVVERTVADFTEYTVCCVEIEGELLIADPIGINIIGEGLFSYKKKYLIENAAELERKCTLNADTIVTVKDYCRRIYRGMGLRHCSRIDFFVCKNGDIMLLEINTFPGIVPGHSILPLALEELEIPMGRFSLSNMSN